ncbi:hypothetical protein Hypma_004117 [Hypsizygus marmoreus]|uniref:Uncharacterized protein n=1 Tax=Hypsizygus marmoreus TaxID=39966 RepID=A0A369K0B7_HYPMA|nr:hypothetical protein Hypma_004117 [Hypsizygus marmoreus]
MKLRQLNERQQKPQREELRAVMKDRWLHRPTAAFVGKRFLGSAYGSGYATGAGEATGQAVVTKERATIAVEWLTTLAGGMQIMH